MTPLKRRVFRASLCVRNRGLQLVGVAVERLNVAWQRLLADTVRAGAPDGVLSCDDPYAAAWRNLSLLDGLALQAVAHRDVIDRGAVVSWSVAYAERELCLSPGALAS